MPWVWCEAPLAGLHPTHVGVSSAGREGLHLGAEGSLQPVLLDALIQELIPAHRQTTPAEVDRWVCAAPRCQHGTHCLSVSLQDCPGLLLPCQRWYRWVLLWQPSLLSTCQVAVCGPSCSKPWTQPVTTCHWLWWDLLGVDQGLGHTSGDSLYSPCSWWKEVGLNEHRSLLGSVIFCHDDLCWVVCSMPPAPSLISSSGSGPVG